MPEIHPEGLGIVYLLSPFCYIFRLRLELLRFL